MMSGARAAILTGLLGLWIALSAPLAAQTPVPSCRTPAALLDTPWRLPRTAQRLAAGEPLRIVALGSSSTQGTGASDAAHTYPEQLRAALQELFARTRIVMLNRGVAGEDTTAMLARFRRDVLDEAPDLLIWQAGVNTALRGGDPAQLVEDLERGIALARDAGIDVMLMDAQRAPRFDSRPFAEIFLRAVRVLAEVNRVPLVQRHAIMSHWLESGQLDPGAMIGPDGLHLTDASYACLGRAVARMIARQSPVPVAALRD